MTASDEQGPGDWEPWCAPATTRFSSDGRKFGQVYAAAAQLARGRPAPDWLYLGTEDRFVIAASLLAALSGGPSVLVPCGLQSNLLQEALAAQPCAGEIGTDLTVPPVDVGAPPLPPTQLADEPCAALFTGGSTGRPKIWYKTRKNLIAETAFLQSRFAVSGSDRVLATVSPLHIYGLLFSVLLPVRAGARLVRRTAYYPAEVIKLVARTVPTILVAAPAHIAALGNVLPPRTSLRLAISSGGMLTREASVAFTDRTGVPVVEVYGSTETGGIATRCRRDGEEVWTPFPDVDWRIDDGQLCVRSPFASAGLSQTAAQWVRTGDRAEAADGNRFHLVGRVDGIVKVGGKRVDLGEVEQALMELRGVQDAFVLARRTDGLRETEVCALVATERTSEAIRAGLGERLPSVALPRRVRAVTTIPRTAAGKPDRGRALALLDDAVAPGATAFMYPGQGCQSVGMIQRLFGPAAPERSILAEAEDILRLPLGRIIAQGPEEELARTSWAQPALLVTCLMIRDALVARGMEPTIVLGHSLGEYAALVHAGVLSFRDALRLVRTRGLLMERAVEHTPGKMAAVIRAELPALEALVARLGAGRVLEIANYNAPEQVVLSGHAEAIDAAIEEIVASRLGGAMELKVSAPFHSSLMRPMADEFAAALGEVAFRPPQLQFVGTVSGEAESDPERLRARLVEQLTRPVRWEAAARRAVSLGAVRFVETGPGSVLAGLLKRVDRSVSLVTAKSLLSARPAS